MKWKCFLDLDDVLVDFIAGACKTHGRPNPYKKPEARGRWDIAKLLGMTDLEFWQPLDNHHFWINLRPTKDAEAILRVVEHAFGEQNVCLLTDPSGRAGPPSGKMAWVQRFLPSYTRRLLIGSPKYFCAASDAVLIDDADHNVEAFRRHGGQAILVPRPWNANHRHTSAIVTVGHALESFINEE